MDVSKLPKLSDTQKQQQAEAQAAAATTQPAGSSGSVASVGSVDTARTHVSEAVVPYATPDMNATPIGGADAWLSVAIGAILLLLNMRLLSYVFARSSFTWTFNDAAGNPLPYPKTVFFWGDLALVTFALVMIIEGLILGIAPRKWSVAMALAFTVGATILNFGYVAYMMSNGYGFQLMSALAVAFGVYIAAFEWNVLKRLDRRATAAP